MTPGKDTRTPSASGTSLPKARGGDEPAQWHWRSGEWCPGQVILTGGQR